MNKKILITAALLGVISVILGAFGAHGLKALISSESIQTFETGVRYQMYHAIVLLFVGNTVLVSEKSKQIIFYLILFGILLFSGSIYGLSTNSLTGFDFKTIGFVTPIGGLLLLISWAILLINFLKLKAYK
ncbi:DUF423 domain-containing protein [Ichthyenterobacterium magnum]|uniref:Uncharacterized membrane protein YgdD (TMEM256/DUF423 family) n=1 Tax=Ichthyenterobacterium magnum TaxID=1230530 RepID=A0A420DWA8_9FLAO|nr:DUF423 domain-containing protein [Ichthyenterobacterium magnum]RKE98512.1 uncharacterized membrane protein YgdD (TMEM256/DUF423 family) [Ichthyenterobacterium magnum]